MATAAGPRGRLVEYLTKKESTFGTAPSGNWMKTLAYSDTLSEEQPFEDDPLLGQARNNNRDTTEPAPGLPNLTGQIVAPVDLNHLWIWLEGALGAPTSSGSSDYTHTFVSGGEVLPHRSIEKKVKSDVFIVETGMLVNKLMFDLSRKAGYERCTVEFAPGFKELKNSSTGGGTPATILARDAIAAKIAILKIAGSTVADILSVRMEYDNKAIPDESLGNAEGRIQGHDLDDMATCSGTIEMRFRNATMYDLAKAGTPSTAEILWERSATRSLSLQMAAMRLAATGVPIGGPGRIQQTFNFRCEQTSGAAMLTAVLKSASAAAAYV